MAGVISRSAYLEAKTPADGVEKGNSKRRLSVYFGISASSSRIWQSFPPFLYIGTPQYKVRKLWLLLKNTLVIRECFFYQRDILSGDSFSSHEVVPWIEILLWIVQSSTERFMRINAGFNLFQSRGCFLNRDLTLICLDVSFMRDSWGQMLGHVYKWFFQQF